MRTAVIAFGQHMAEQDIGRLRVGDWLLADPPRFPGVADDEVGGKHHMGTTRMSADDRSRRRRRRLPGPRHRQPLRRRLSVFPTTGHCNPTYTLTQLALRLGDHLAGWLAA